MANILPTLKETKRYIAFETIGDSNKKELEESVLRLIGEIDYARSGFKIITLKENKGIIQVNNEFLNKTKAALGLTKTKINTLNTSGLINKAKKYIGDE
jgi:RNase P/RNase MRP subunit POP5